jgi:radical SAM superfamily enzyme YgiQ (UPF0313 family)
LTRVFVGVESATREQLAFYRKRYHPGSNQSAFIRKQLGILEELDIDVIPGILTYHPEVSREELRDTWHLIELCGSHNAGQFLKEIIAYPGTPLHRAYEKAGYLRGEWPTTGWQFRDPRAEAHRAAMKQVVAEEGVCFERLKSEFFRLLKAWNSLVTPQNRRDS